ncbi:hypothetical protein GLE_3210 [Lysobacter enzymogenes]|uniref:Uncharacterized protein n=1 Tax=Lysobacter enzymogenes TaxID=69 RepID=A0A0S2DJ43_LYSEN|nr:hypothetical protein GLE_3210 [Lysobacter enzymogenes]
MDFDVWRYRRALPRAPPRGPRRGASSTYTRSAGEGGRATREAGWAEN